MDNSDADFTLFIDSDIPYTNDSIIALIEKLITSNEIDIVIGVRDRSYKNQLHGRRRVLSYSLLFFNRRFLGLQNYDSQAGLKAMNNKGKKAYLTSKANRFLVDLEFLVRAKKRNLKIVPIVIQAREDLHSSSISLSALIKEIPSLIRIAYLHFYH